MIDMPIAQPKREIFVMLLGNHSAGKSSFINWYLGQEIQKTSVAIEMQGFSLIAHGTQRKSLNATATLDMFPFLQPLASQPGIMENLSTEICVLRANLFPLIVFIDTPGLVDGDMKVNRHTMTLNKLTLLYSTCLIQKRQF
jgi:hypothetical protein